MHMPLYLPLLMLTGCAGTSSSWAANCAIQQRDRCALQLPRCNPDRPIQPQPWVTEPVVVEGHISETGSSCTEAACPPYTCCNTCSSALLIETHEGERLRLTGDLDGREIACRGDDSMPGGCCPLPPGTTTVRLIGRMLPPDASSRSAAASASFEASAACMPRVHP